MCLYAFYAVFLCEKGWKHTCARALLLLSARRRRVLICIVVVRKRGFVSFVENGGSLFTRVSVQVDDGLLYRREEMALRWDGLLKIRRS